MIKSNKTQGFTLLELMITLAVAAIMMSIALPSFMSLIRDSRMTANTNDFLTALNYARSEAVTRNVDVIVQSNGSWEAGWDIYIDANGDNLVNADERLKTHSALATGYTLNAAISSVVYESTGLRNTPMGVSFFLCLNGDVSKARAIIINNVGRARTDSAAACS